MGKKNKYNNDTLKSFSLLDIIIPKIEKELNISEGELQQLIQNDLEKLVGTYISKRVPAILVLLHLQTLVDAYIKEMGLTFKDIVVCPDKVAGEVKEVYGMTDEETKPIDEEIERLSKGL